MTLCLNLTSEPISPVIDSTTRLVTNSLSDILSALEATSPILIVSDDHEHLSNALSVLAIADVPIVVFQTSEHLIENMPHGVVQVHKLEDVVGAIRTVGDIQETKPLRLQVVSSERNHIQTRCLSGYPADGQTLRVLPRGEANQIVEVIQHTDDFSELKLSSAVMNGDILCEEAHPSQLSDQFSIRIAWLGTEPLYSGRTYLFEHLGKTVSGSVTGIKFRMDAQTKTEHIARSILKDELGEITVNLDCDIVFDPIDVCGALGRLLIRDPVSQEVIGIGGIQFSLRRAQNVHKQALVIDRTAREKLNGHKGRVVWFTGLSGSGKSTVANAVEQALHLNGTRTYVLDGDNVRHGLSKDLGFTDADRVENIRRIAEVAKLMVDAGLVVLTAFISPFRSERDMARAMFTEGEFVEVFVDVPLSIAEARDPKGLYKKARSGDLPNFTGIDSEYEPPEFAEIVIRTDQGSIESCARNVLQFLDEH